MDDRYDDQRASGPAELLELVRAQRRLVDDQQRQIEELRAEMAGLRHRLDGLGRFDPTEGSTGDGPDHASSIEPAVAVGGHRSVESDAPGPPAGPPSTDRRSFVRIGAAVAGAAATTAWLAAAHPDAAAAATGDSLVLGHIDNVADAGTGLEVTGSSHPYGIAVTDNGLGAVPAEIKAAVLGHTNAGAFQQGVVGYATNFGTAVWGRNDVGGTGVRGDCTSGHGVEGRAPGAGGVGVYGIADQSFGVRGDATSGLGVFGLSTDGTAVAGQSTNGVGGYFTGATSAIVLGGAFTPPAQQALAHRVGSLTVDGNGDLWYCTAAGTPGTWRQLSGPSSAGALSVLPASKRIYDSRTTIAGRFVDHEERVIDATLGGNVAVPPGASAVLVNVTATNTNPGGYFSFFANGVTWPGTSSMNWGLPDSTIANLAVVPVDAAAGFVARCEGQGGADLVIDYIGAFR